MTGYADEIARRGRLRAIVALSQWNDLEAREVFEALPGILNALTLAEKRIAELEAALEKARAAARENLMMGTPRG